MPSPQKRNRASRRTRWRRWASLPLGLPVLLACALASLGIGLATWQRIGFEHEQAIDAGLQANANLTLAFEQQVFRTLKSTEQIAALVREQYQRQGHCPPLQQWVHERVIREDLFSIISIVNASGDVVCSSRPGTGVNYADRPFFRAQQQAQGDALFINPPVLGRVSGITLLPMSLRMEQPDGRFAGVVVLAVAPEALTRFDSQTQLGAQGRLEISGLDGQLRARSNNGQPADLDTPAWLALPAQAAASSGSLVDDGTASDGVARLVSYRTMADYPLVLSLGTGLAATLAATEQRRSSYLAWALLASSTLWCLTGLLVWALARQRRVAQALRASEALFRATFRQAAMGIAHIAVDGRILRANDKLCQLLGYSQEQLQQLRLPALWAQTPQPPWPPWAEQDGTQDNPLPETEKIYQRQDGALLWVSEALSVVRRSSGRPHFLLAMVQDISARKHLEVRLAHDARHDALTGLPNRLLFHDRLQQVLASAQRQGQPCCVLYIDLDGFKGINDAHGHAAGDQLLWQAARRMQDCVRGEDTVARFGGDEFGIVLAHITQSQDGHLVGEKILQALAQPFTLNAAQVRISASVGAALYPAHGNDQAQLLAQADSAMYQAKHGGKNRFCWAQPPSNAD